MHEYTPELEELICEGISSGKSMRQLCDAKKDDKSFPSRSTLLRWLAKYPEFEAKCARARELQADSDFEKTGEIIEKLEEGTMEPDVARVIMSGLQWRASKLKPKRYGDKALLENNGDITIVVNKGCDDDS
jgi:hypothetical protein